MESNQSKLIPKNFILDVDGVLNSGQFHYTEHGKSVKVFGPDDTDALGLVKHQLHIHFISGDKRGFAITRKRVVEDMGYPLELVSTFQRLDWIRERYNLAETIFMGDGIFDALVFPHVAYAIAPANAFYKTKELAHFVTQSKGGESAVAEAVIHIMDKFFKPFNLFDHDFSNGSGIWEKH